LKSYEFLADPGVSEKGTETLQERPSTEASVSKTVHFIPRKPLTSRYKQLNTSKPITIRVNQLDLIKLKAKAKEKNIPYQTLLSSLIRDFAAGDYTLKI
jgi:predicted DNA binding CopG/RHH family protein